MKLAAPIIAALALTGCSWAFTTKVPDKWTPNQELRCTSHKWLSAVDTLVPPGLLATAIISFAKLVDAPDDPDDYSDEERVWEQIFPLALVTGGIGLITGWPSASNGSTWADTCRDAKKKRTEWLSATPEEQLKTGDAPFKKSPASPPPRLTF